MMLRRPSWPVWVLVGVLVCPGPLSASMELRRTPEVLLDAVAAMVNDRPILVSDVLRQIQSADRQAASQFQGARLEQELNRNYREGLQALIERELILAEANRRKLDLPDEAVDAQIRLLIRERFGGDRAAFLTALSADGLTYEAYRQQIRDDLRAMLLRRQEVNEKVRISPAQIRRAYEQNRDRYRETEQVRVRILVVPKGTPGADDEFQRREAESLRERVRRGESFAELAQRFSKGPAADRGGDLGWRPLTELRSEIADVVRTMRVGEVGPVLDLPDGWYLVFLEGRREARERPLAEVAPELERELYREAVRRRTEEWLTELRSRNYVRVFLEERPPLP